MTVTDNDSGLSATQTFNWIVNDSAMKVTASSISATEGEDATFTVATFTDSDPNWTSGDFVASVLWGDGTSDDNENGNAIVSGSNGTFTLTDDHAYSSTGSYSPTIEISDGFQNVSATGSASVAAAPLTVTGGFMQGGVGDEASGDWAAISDGNPLSNASDFNATIYWGDGTSSAGSITGADGEFAVSGGHDYSTTGPQNVTVVVNDTADGRSSTVSSTAQMGQLFVGETYTLSVASFTSSDSSAVAGQFTATIDWGDGNTTTGTVTGSGGSFLVNGIKDYAVDSYDEPGNVYNVSVTVNGPQNEAITCSETIGVERPSAITVIGETIVAQPSIGFTGATVAMFTDPDAADTAGKFDATIFWGDGSSSTGTVQGTDGIFLVTGGHTYDSPGDHAIEVLVAQGWDDKNLVAAANGAEKSEVKNAPILLSAPNVYAQTLKNTYLQSQAKFTNGFAGFQDGVLNDMLKGMPNFKAHLTTRLAT